MCVCHCFTVHDFINFYIIRDDHISELSEKLNATVAASDFVTEKLRRAEVAMSSAQEIMAAEDAAHVAAMEKLTADVEAERGDRSLREMLVIDLSSSLEKALIIEEALKGQVNNVTMHLNELLIRQQTAAKKIVEESLLSSKDRPWFRFLWPF